MRAWHARCCGAPDRRSHVIPDRRSSRRSAVPRYLSGYATTVLLVVSEPTGFVAQKLMKTAGRENQKRCANEAASRDHGTEGQNNPAQRGGLEAKKKSGHRRSVFFLTPFIELTGS